MMKRIVSLLLAAMMLFGSAMADAAKVTVTWDADVEGAKLFWQESSDAEGSTLQSIAEALVELMENLQVEIIAQDSGAYMSITLKDTVILDTGIESGWDYSYMFSNFWEGYYLTANATQDQAKENEKAWNILSAMDWSTVGKNLVVTAVDWLDDQPTVEELGHFVGDTYEGATLRRSYTFDDRAISALVDQLLLSLESDGITEELMQNYLGEDIDPLPIIRHKNTQVADDNRFSYILREAYGPSGEYMGASFVVLENDQQVMTLSHGVAANGWRLVWGYGLNGQNYYLNLDAMQQEDGSRKLRLYLFNDLNGSGFRAIENGIEYLMMMVAGTFYPAKDGEWSTLAEIEVLGQSIDRYVVEGISKDVTDAEYTVKWYRGDDDVTPLQTICINVAPCEAKTWDVSTMVPIDLETDGGEELFSEIVQENVQKTVLTLFKLLPTQLLTMLMM